MEWNGLVGVGVRALPQRNGEHTLKMSRGGARGKTFARFLIADWTALRHEAVCDGFGQLEGICDRDHGQ